MSRWKPCKRRDFIQKLRQLGFEGPFSGTKHQLSWHFVRSGVCAIVLARLRFKSQANSESPLKEDW